MPPFLFRYTSLKTFQMFGARPAALGVRPSNRGFSDISSSRERGVTNFGHDALESKAKSTTPPSRPVTLLPMRRLVDFDATPLSTTQQPTCMSIFRQVRAERGSCRRNMAIDGSGGPFEHNIFMCGFFLVFLMLLFHAFAAKTGVFEGGKEEDYPLPCRARPATVLDIALVQRDRAGDFLLDSSKIIENDGLGGCSPWPFPFA